MSEDSDVDDATSEVSSRRGNKRVNRKAETMRARGSMEELGNNVYLYGSKNHDGDAYIKTTDAIAKYVGCEYNKAMWMLVKYHKEVLPTEPAEPSGKDVSSIKLKKYECELSQYHAKLDDYEEYKAKVFVIMKGQCSLI
jgi:hypothetical protein